MDRISVHDVIAMVPQNDNSRRALADVDTARARAQLWLSTQFRGDASDYTRTQALAVLSAWRFQRPLTSDALRWLEVMTKSFDPLAREAAETIKGELLARH